MLDSTTIATAKAKTQATARSFYSNSSSNSGTEFLGGAAVA